MPGRVFVLVGTAGAGLLGAAPFAVPIGIASVATLCLRLEPGGWWRAKAPVYAACSVFRSAPPVDVHEIHGVLEVI